MRLNEMRSLWFIILIGAFALSARAQLLCRARVVDAATGEVLPYASVYVSEKRGTLTNQEGNFTLIAEADDVLRISFIGYVPQRIKADQLPDVVSLKPMTATLREVTVIPVEHILLKVIKKLNREHKRHAWQERNYFFRLTCRDSVGLEVMEAFFKAYSAVNLRDIGILSGKYFRRASADGIERASDFTHSNLHQLLQLGPLIPIKFQPPISERLNLPLPPWARQIGDLDGRSFSCQLLTSEESEDIYKIHIRVNPWACAAAEKMIRASQATTSDSLALSGTLFVEKKSLSLLAFDGDLEGFAIKEYHQDEEKLMPANVHLHIDYDRSHGFTEPAAIHCNFRYADTKARLVAFRVRNARFYNMFAMPAANNLLFAIQLVGHDPSLWKQSIIQRTTEEEQIIQEVSRQKKP